MTRLSFVPAIIVLLSATMPAVADTHAPFIDWVPYQELTLEQQAKRAPYCSGQFVEPAWEGLSLSPNGQSETVVLKAQQLSVGEDSQWSASGNAALTYEDVLLGAGRIHYDDTASNSTLSDNVLIRVPQVAITGSDAEFNIQGKSGEVSSGFFVLHNTGFSGRAAHIAMEPDGYILTDTTFTPCDPSDPAWHIKASSTRIYSDKGIAVAKHARVTLGAVPIIYTPYLSIPIDDKRHSGFLSPSIDLKIDNNEWAINSFSVPIYWNIAPQVDNTFTPFYQFDHHWYFDNETRYLTDSSQGLVNIGWNPSESRWMGEWDHKQSLAWDTTLQVDWHYTSDRSMPVDFKGNDEYATFDHQGITLNKTALHSEWLFTAERWLPVDLSLASNQYPYAIQPGINITGNQQFAPLADINWAFDISQFARNLSDTQALTLDQFNGETAEGTRTAAAITWSAPLQAMDWRIVPSARLSLSQYDLTTPGTGRPETTSWYQPSVWLTLDRSQPISTIGESIETAITPKLQWLYSPYHMQYDAPVFDTNTIDFDKTQLFNTRRFSGMDRAGDMNRLSASIKNQLIHHPSGQQVTATVAQILRLAPERLGLRSDADTSTQANATPIYASLLWEPTDDIDLQVDVDWNTAFDYQQRSAIDLGFSPSSLDYQVQLERLWNLPSRQVAEESARVSVSNGTRQRVTFEDVKVWSGTQWQENLSMSGYTPVAQRWGLSTSIDYDVTAEQLKDSLLGLEYDSCCWNLRLLTKVNWLSINDTLPFNSLYIEFTLKGLGQNNSTVESLLSTHIDGYNGRIYR